MVLCERNYDNLDKHEYNNNQYVDNDNQYQYVNVDLDEHEHVDLDDDDIINMIVKQGYAIPGVWQITASDTTKQLAGPCEISSLKLISVGGSAHVKIYDSTGSADSMSLKWVLDSSTYTNDTHDFVNPLAFNKGVYAVCEDGFTFSPILCIAKVTPR